MFNKLIRRGQADKELSVSRLPRLLLQLHALTDNPMNITVTGNITVSATLENSGQIGLTVGQYTYGGNQWQYGYSSADYASDQVYGSLSPDTFHGIKITSLSAGLIVDPSSQQPLLHILWIFFANSLSQSSIKMTINNKTYTLSDPNGSAHYYVDLPDNDTSLVMWLQSQVGKTITVNLE
jgi:hypothetical protein